MVRADGRSGDERPAGSTWHPRAVLVVVVAGYLAASLFPFVVDLPVRVDNGAVRVGEAIAFPEPGMVTFPGTTQPFASLDDDDLPLRFIVDVEAASDDAGRSRILTLSSGPESQSFLIGQMDANLLVRYRWRGSSRTGQPQVRVPDVFARPGVHRVMVEVDRDLLTIAVDGAEVAREEANGLHQWDPGHRLLLGNEHGGMRPWLGRIDVATLTTSSGTVDLLAAGELPGQYWEVPDRLLTAFSLEVGLGVVDLLHALALALIGWLGMQLRPRPRARRVLVACWALSTLTLLAKIAVVGRHPSLGDLVVEFAAAAVGVAIAKRWQRRPDDVRTAA